MTDLAAQLDDIDTQLQALSAQKILLAQQAAEDPLRTASRDAVAAVVAGSAFWGGTIKATISTALHPDWVTLDLPLDGLEGVERLARLQLAQQLIRRGGELGYAEEVQEAQEGGGLVVIIPAGAILGGGVLRREVPGRVLLHRERAEDALAAVALEYGW